jgi:FKBP-type peptidyl-prolyl cis-trans isomerase
MQLFIKTGLLIITVLLISCKSKTRHYSIQEQQEFKENLIKANKGLVEKDQENIADVVKRHGWNMTQTQTGLWYEIVKHGNGTKAKTGMTAHIKYSVQLLNGTECYNSDSLGIKSFKIGQGGVESGLEEGILLLRQGDAARFIMPPHLAHGLLGDEDKIPPRATIIYNVELSNLTK